MENWRRLSHLFVTVFLSNFSQFMVTPAIPDVTLAAICPGKDECSAAIYLTGVQQAISGMGSVIMMPLIGKLSDVYGRKAVMTIPLVLAIIPLVTLAWERTSTFLYAYFVINTLTAMVAKGGVVCLALAYLADNIPEEERISAFGVMSGVISFAYLGSTLAARLLYTARIFQVAAAMSAIAAIYTTVFLKENIRETDSLKQPILKVIESNEDHCSTSNKGDVKTQSPQGIFGLLKSSTTFSLAAFVAFFNSLSDAGVEACLMYFLKARFHFNKNQFADILLINNVGSTLSNLLFMPTLGPLIGEKKLLSLGLFAGFLNMFFDSIAWASWVPYAFASTSVFFSLTTPNIRSIISKEVGPNEQGLAQGCILGITAFANFMSPLIYSPLSALVLAEDSPFHFRGFGILCIAFALLIGFLLSIMILIFSRTKSKKNRVDA